MRLYLDLDELTALEARFSAAPGQSTPAQRIELAWHLRQRDSRRALGLLDGLAEAADGAGAPLGAPHSLARAGLIRAEIAALFCEPDEADAWLAKARAEIATAGHELLTLDALLVEATVARARGQFGREMQAYERAQALGTALADAERLGVARGLAAMENAGSQPALSIETHADDETLDPAHEAFFSAAKALALSRREPAVAVELFTHASELAHQTGWIRLSIVCLLNAGTALQGLADFDGAAACFGDALSRARRTGWPAMLGASRTCVGRLLREQGQLEASRAVLAAAVRALAPVPNSMNAANAHAELAQTLLAMGLAPESLAPMSEAIRVLRQLEATGNLALNLIGMARVLGAAGQPQAALLTLREVAALIDEHQLQALRTGLFDALADLHRRHELPAPPDMQAPNAVVHYAEATLATGQSIPNWKPPATLLAGLAEAWASAGQMDKAYGYARRAYAAKSDETSLKLSNPLALLRLMHLEEAQPTPDPEAAEQAGNDEDALSATLLTPKEREVLRLLARNYSNKEIAQALGIGSETVKTHLKRIFAKLDAYSRKHAVSRARNLGMLSLAY